MVDPAFNEVEFLEGCKLALPTITEYIKTGDYIEFSGLFSQRAKEALIKDIETNWTELQKNNISVKVQDVKSLAIDRISCQTLGRDVFADIQVKYDTVKQDLQPNVSMKLTLTFSRKYGPGCFPDWTITNFKIDHFGPLWYL